MKEINGYKYSLEVLDSYSVVVSIKITYTNGSTHYKHIYTEQPNKDIVKETVLGFGGSQLKSIEICDIQTKDEADWQSQMITETLNANL